MDERIVQAEEFVKSTLENESSGHDWHHLDRVRRNALKISKEEQKGDLLVIELAALLHDLPDEKLQDTVGNGEVLVNEFLESISIELNQKEHIKEIIDTISYNGGDEKPLCSFEAEAVRDADRLDAIGAIGVARAFAYGGKKGRPIFDPDLKVRESMTLAEYRNGKTSSLHHFEEKLFKLKSLMKTEAGKRMAEERHQFMEEFVQQFLWEWVGER